MRVTDKMAYNQVTRNLQKNRGEMQDLQNQAATQKRINKPSDDPAAASRVLVNRTEEKGSQQYIKNINIAKSFLEFSDQSLSELSESLVRAKELAIQQASDAGASEDTRRVVAAEVEQIYSQAVQVGNRKLGDRYIFGGFKTTNPPFDLTGEYQGDDGDMKIQVNKDAFVSMNLPGDKVFFGQGLGNDGLVRPKVFVPKTTEDLIQYKADEAERTRRNEEMRQEQMELRGPASTTRSRKVFNSVDDSGSKGINILKTLKDFEVALKVNDKEEIQTAIDNLDVAIAQIINARAQVGSRISTINATTDSLQKAIVDNKTVASNLEDADLFQVVSDMNKSDTTLRATLETSNKLMSQSLMDFIK